MSTYTPGHMLVNTNNAILLNEFGGLLANVDENVNPTSSAIYVVTTKKRMLKTYMGCNTRMVRSRRGLFVE